MIAALTVTRAGEMGNI